MKASIQFLENNLKKNDIIVIACSGGPDSMCLLSILISFQQKFNLQIIVAHVNHKVRLESDDEAKFVADYCKKNKIHFEYKELEKIEKNFESKAREQRYKFFSQVIEKYNAKYLMTAHHGDDLIETILMRITRGSSLKGYGGFNPIVKENNYTIMRPLIFSTKEEIINYMDEKKLHYCLDKSNFDDEHTRNRYRHNVLPFLKTEQLNVHLKFLEFSNTIKQSNDFIINYTNKLLNKSYINNILDLNVYNNEEEIIKENMICEIIRPLYKNNLYLITSKNVKEVMKMLESQKPNSTIYLPYGHSFTKSYDKLYVDYNESILSSIDESHIFHDYINLNGQEIEKISSSTDKSNYTIRLLSSELKMPLYVRTRKTGDKISVKNLNGSKKLKDIFIDSKLPRHQREKQLILTDSKENIIWLPGLKKSKFDKAITEKYDIILKYTRKGE